MIVRASMIEFLLRRQGYDTKLIGDPECEIERIRAERHQRNCRNTLVVIRDADKPVPETPDDTCVFLRVSDRPNKPARNAIGSSNNPDEPTAIESAFEALVTLEKWSASLKDALLEGASLGEFIELGASMIGRPVAYFDRNLLTLAASSDYWNRHEVANDAWPGQQFAGQMPPSMAADLVEDIDYLHAARERGGFYYKSAQHRMFYGINTFDGDDYLARLIFPLAEGEHRLHRGEEQLVDVYHEHLDNLYLRYAGNAQVISSQNDSLHALVRNELNGTSAASIDEASAVLEAFEWSYDDRFLVAKLVFFEGVHWDTVSLYLCNVLEQLAIRSCAYPLHQQIVWMVNLTRAASPGEGPMSFTQRVTTSLVAVLRNYACKAGLSDAFQSFANARNQYIEADRAIEIGQIRNPHYWYYQFSDYAFDYLLSRCTDELGPNQTCHPALMTLVDYDTQHGTEYARTLVCFLRNSQNTTHAAAELYIHRTSFMRRMTHLCELANIDLEDPDEVLHLLLSAKLMGL